MTLTELATKHNHLAKPAPDGEKFSAKHLCAAAVHGWNAYEYHYGAIDMEEDDYLAALESASTGDVFEPANKRS
jgi:hypothetical protein